MFGGLIALLDDVAALAKAAAASLDDVAAGAAKASSKAVAVVVDDTAVTPQYFATVHPSRELPMVWRIVKGSLRNKLLFILPAIIVLSLLIPWIFTPLLMVGGAYLSFEGAEKIWHKIHPSKHDEHSEEAHSDEILMASTPEEAQRLAKESEDRLVSGAVTTDFILSTEVMLISFNAVLDQPLLNRILIMIAVAIIITIGVYGTVALIIKMDDIGLSISQRRSGVAQKFGRGLVNAMPKVMWFITVVGTVAMLWVGGHLVIKGLADLGWDPIYYFGHHVASLAAPLAGIGSALSWLIDTAWSAVWGFIAGTIVMLGVKGVQGIIAKIKISK